MTTKLRALLSHRHAVVETQDVTAGFLRAARERWGDAMPLQPVRYTRGVLTVRCPSPVWRAELLGALRALEHDLTRELPQLSLQRISPVLF